MALLKLTKTVVESLQYARAGQILYFDTELTGFGLRVGRKSKVYIAEARLRGKTTRVKIGLHGRLTTEEARKEAKIILGGLQQGHNPNDVKRRDRASTVTLSEAFEDMKAARSSLKPLTLYGYTHCLEVALKNWKDKPLSSISKDMVQTKHTQLTEKSGPAYANLTMRFLRSLINFAIAKYEDSAGKPLIDDNPVKRLSQTRSWHKIKPRKSVIKKGDLPLWLEVVATLQNDITNLNRELVRDYLLLVLFTGLRKEEAASLMWADVDFEERSFTVRNTKNGEDHKLPMSGFVYHLLKARYDAAGDSAFVFPGHGKSGRLVEPRNQIRQIKDQTGIQFTIHDLRRTFITIVDSLDISAYALKRLVNHKMDNDVTAGYIISDVERLRDPMERIASTILESAPDLAKRVEMHWKNEGRKVSILKRKSGSVISI